MGSDIKLTRRSQALNLKPDKRRHVAVMKCHALFDE